MNLFKSIAACIILSLTNGLWVAAQEVGDEYPITSKTIFINPEGDTISFNDFLQSTSGADYQMEPVFDEYGNIREIYILQSSINRAYKPGQEFIRSSQQQAFEAPPFEAQSLNGQNVQLEDYRGQVVVLKFWFTNCRPCIAEMPELNELVQEFRERAVVFLAPALDPAPSIQSFLKQYPFHYNIIPNARPLAHTFNVFGYPTHMVINPEGKVTAVFTGVNNHIKQRLQDAIESAFAPPATQSEPARPQVNKPQQEKELTQFESGDIFMNESGQRLPFPKVLELLNADSHQAFARQTDSGDRYILIQVKQ